MSKRACWLCGRTVGGAYTVKDDADRSWCRSCAETTLARAYPGKRGEKGEFKIRKLYACGNTPWDLDPSNAGSVDFYCSPEAAHDDQRCTDSCGIVEFEVVQTRVVRKAKEEKGTPASYRRAREKKFIALADELRKLALKRTKSRDLQRSAFTWALAGIKIAERKSRKAKRVGKRS